MVIYKTRVIFCAVINILTFVIDLSVLLEDVLNALGSTALLCILGNHLLIHLREAADEGQNEGTSYRTKSLSTIGFEQGVELSELGEHCHFLLRLFTSLKLS